MLASMMRPNFSDPQRLSVRQLLIDRTFGPFFWGKLFSSTGNWIQNITSAVVVFSATGSPLATGLVSALQFAGPLLLSPLAGALTDRWNRRHLLMGGRAISATAALLLGLYVLSGGVETSVTPIYVGTTLLGVGLGISAPAMHALVPQLVNQRDLETAVALSTSTGNMARAVGPAIGTSILILAGPGAAYLTAAGAHSLYLIGLSLIVQRGLEPARRGPLGVLDGFRHVVRERPLLKLLLSVVVLSVGADPVITLAPAIGSETLGSERWAGALATAFGLGAVAGVGLVRRATESRGLRHTAISSLLVFGAGLVLAASTRLFPVIVAGFFIAGLGFLVSTASITTRIQRRIPERLRGRIMALWAMAFLGSRPFAALLNGSMAEFLSTRVALAVSALLVASGSLLAAAQFGPEASEPERAK